MVTGSPWRAAPCPLHPCAGTQQGTLWALRTSLLAEKFVLNMHYVQDAILYIDYFI